MFFLKILLLAAAVTPENDVIEFDAAYFRGWKLVDEHPEHRWGCWNGDNSRLPVRKAQYHWVCDSHLTITAA